jgi:DNA repair exonuclease SbcCD ATPase subunit
MPEISAAELRRLEALSERIVRVDQRRRTVMEARDAARAEVKKLRATIREMTGEAGEQKTTIEDLERKIAELVTANADQAGRLVIAERSAGQAAIAASKLADARDDLKEKLAADKAKLKDATKQVVVLQKTAGTLKKQVAVLESQVAATDLPVFLPAEKVGELLDDFVTQFDVGGLRVTDGDVRLTVAFAGTGNGAAFVIPSTAAEKDEMPLHTVNLKLGPRPPLLEEDPGL